MNRVYLKTYGCQMNERDSDAVASMLRDRGYSIVDDEHQADIILLNTCAVRDQAEQKAIGKTGYLAKRKRNGENLILGILGCMAQNRGAELLDRLPDLDLLVGTQKFHRVPEMLDQIIASQKGLGPRPSTLVELDAEEGSQNTIRTHMPDERKVTAFVSIMQGCNMACTFCIVPKTRGEERCRPIAEIVEEVRELAEKGTREIMLLGQIVTSYGRGVIPGENGKSPFVQLIEAISEVPGIERIRFTSPHPRGFKEDLIEAFGRLPKLMPQVHLPMQSGSDRVLKLMNRPYSAARYKQIVDDLRAVNPGIFFSTDIIVGFPGETDEDFEQTRVLFDTIGFDMAYIFKYSIRTGTPAAAMGDQIPAEVKDQRNDALLQILEKHSLANNLKTIGTVQQVLVEGLARKGGVYNGRTPPGRKVLFAGSERIIGQIVPIRIDSATVTVLNGEMLMENGESSSQ
ncbi:MAG: tRNA (N6-isopentenyl adenosine(37)-C2)-methylthiotransferase MiaB [Verrucomicrobiota bacterium]|nr:tRNA (N6-isopentenyl adenosine(37)-C2)-methylthiotransferase MiaB [Verrucomicrobiota bacterium]